MKTSKHKLKDLYHRNVWNYEQKIKRHIIFLDIFIANTRKEFRVFSPNSSVVVTDRRKA
jgi:phosphatidylserine decarboxylase